LAAIKGLSGETFPKLNNFGLFIKEQKMARRSKDWNEGLSSDLKDRNFAREFILAAIEDGMVLKTVLAKVIRAYGVKEFAKVVKMAESNLVRLLSTRSNPTQETLNRLLKPFGLRLAVAPITPIKPKKAS
jgi:DNA-binding phage protein